MSRTHKKTSIFIKVGAFARKMRRMNEEMELKLSGPKLKVPTSIADEPKATRVGCNLDQKTPFVENSTEVLFNYYYAYKNTKCHLYWMPYADGIELKQKNLGFPKGKDVDSYRIKRSTSVYSVPPALKKHADAAIECFKRTNKLVKLEGTDEYENNISARIRFWEKDYDKIEIEKATYFNQVGTNLTMDWASNMLKGGKYATIRNTIERPVKGKLPKLSDSVFANTLGVAVMFVTKDDSFYVPIRGTKQAVMAERGGQFHCSASGVFKWSEKLELNETNRFDLFGEGMRLEIKDEMNIEEDEFTLIPIAFARELARGGKPQLFYVAKCSLTEKEIKERRKDAIERWEYIEPEELKESSPLHPWVGKAEKIDYEQKLIEDCFTYEGWAALQLSLAYIKGQDSVFAL